jgi:hypothetical protein
MVFAFVPAPRQICNAGTATAPLQRTKLVNGDKYMARIQLCTATRVKLNQLCTQTAKTHAILSSHRDSFPAKARGLCPDASSSNAY